jgi:hypothetical protein
MQRHTFACGSEWEDDRDRVLSEGGGTSSQQHEISVSGNLGGEHNAVSCAALPSSKRVHHDEANNQPRSCQDTDAKETICRIDC